MPSHDPPGRPWLALGGLLVGLGALLLARRPVPAFATAGRPSPTTPSAEQESEPADDHVFDYEAEDADAGMLAKVMAVAALVIGLAICGLFGLLWRFHSADQAQPALTAQQSAVITPPGPLLQSDPFRDIGALRDRETQLLGTYAWLDAGRRRARIPIARAQALVVGRPLDPTP